MILCKLFVFVIVGHKFVNSQRLGATVSKLVAIFKDRVDGFVIFRLDFFYSLVNSFRTLLCFNFLNFVDGCVIHKCISLQHKRIRFISQFAVVNL